MMKDAYAFKLSLFVQIIKHNLIHDDNVALFPLGSGGSSRRGSENMEFGYQFNAELITPRKKSSHIQNFPYVGGNGFVVGYELLRPVKRVAGHAWYLRTHEVIGICQSNIRAEVTGDSVKPAVIEMVDVFHELLAVHRKLPPCILSG